MSRKMTMNGAVWPEVLPGVLLVPVYRAASSALLGAVRAVQGRELDPHYPHNGFILPQHPDYSMHARSIPSGTVFVVPGRDPWKRFRSARAHLRADMHHVPAEDWDVFMSWAENASDGHVVPTTTLLDRYFPAELTRLVRIENYAAWGPDLKLPRKLERSNTTPAELLEDPPAHLLPRILKLYGRDYDAFGYERPEL